MRLDTFWEKIFFSFVMIQAGITLAMGIIGIIFLPGIQVPYTAFFLPFFFAAICLIPLLIFRSKKEPSIRQLLVLKMVKLIMLEAIVLGMQKLLSPSTSMKIMAAIGVSVMVIWFFIQIVSWRYEVGEADVMNRKLQEYRDRK